MIEVGRGRRAALRALMLALGTCGALLVALAAPPPSRAMTTTMMMTSAVAAVFARCPHPPTA